MTRPERLNNIAHKNLKVKPMYSAELGDNIATCLTFITEFAEVQKEYPIVFRNDRETGGFQPIVLLGLQKNENLFLTSEYATSSKHPGWRADYVPAAVARGPFMIGYQSTMENGEEQKVPVIHVDMESPRLTEGEGLRVFLEQGGNSPYLNQVSDMLNLIRDGMQLNKSMMEAFNHYGLVESVAIQIQLNNGDRFEISDFYTINSDKLAALDGGALQQLNRFGFLQAAFFVVASLSNMKKLIDIKNRRVNT